MVLIPEIDGLLNADEQNVLVVRQLLNDFDPDLPEVINQGCVLYKTAKRIFGQGLQCHFKPVAELLEKFGAKSLDELKKDLKPGSPIRNSETENMVRQVYDQFISRETRIMLLLRIGNLWISAAADLMRMRVTGPLAYSRLQCESFALSKIMSDEPHVASEWRDIESNMDGIKFYKKYQKLIIGELDKYDLKKVYELASYTAMHSRFVGTVLGLNVEANFNKPVISQKIELRIQEFNPQRPDIFIVWILMMLRVQENILTNVTSPFPEIKDELLIQTRIPKFKESIQKLFNTLRVKYPEPYQKYITT